MSGTSPRTRGPPPAKNSMDLCQRDVRPPSFRPSRGRPQGPPPGPLHPRPHRGSSVASSSGSSHGSSVPRVPAEPGTSPALQAWVPTPAPGTSGAASARLAWAPCHALGVNRLPGGSDRRWVLAPPPPWTPTARQRSAIGKQDRRQAVQPPWDDIQQHSMGPPSRATLGKGS